MIYADNAASTRLSEHALQKMMPFLREHYGNPSSLHTPGTFAHATLQAARQDIADAIGADPSEIFFTSGGSESNSWVIQAFASANPDGHIITSSIEHASVLNACHAAEQAGARITYLPVEADGRVSIEHLQNAITPQTKLVSIMTANNEIGTIQPVAHMAEMLHAHHIPFHTDAVQAVGHIPVDVRSAHFDFLSASAHKFHGPKGIGFVYIKKGFTLPPIIFGGKQEYGLRGGTENLPGIVAMAAALHEAVDGLSTESQRLANLVHATWQKLQKSIPDIRFNAQNAPRLPGLLSLPFPSTNGSALANLLNLKDIYISTGSACHAGNTTPSHILTAIGLPASLAQNTIRISYGRDNTLKDADDIADALIWAYHKIHHIPV